MNTELPIRDFLKLIFLANAQRTVLDDQSIAVLIERDAEGPDFRQRVATSLKLARKAVIAFQSKETQPVVQQLTSDAIDYMMANFAEPGSFREEWRLTMNYPEELVGHMDNLSLHDMLIVAESIIPAIIVKALMISKLPLRVREMEGFTIFTKRYAPMIRAQTDAHEPVTT